MVSREKSANTSQAEVRPAAALNDEHEGEGFEALLVTLVSQRPLRFGLRLE